MNIDSLARKEVEAALEKTKKALVKSHEIIVQDWKSDVGFRAAKYIRKDRMWVTVFPVGADREIWFYVDLGTKPHDIPTPILPKRAKALSFRAGGTYVPKTLAKPARTVSGGGKVTGGTKVVVAAVYNKGQPIKHPGSEGRHFTKQIAEDIQPSFKREVENAFKRVANAGG
ncbi:MAG: hypothetical protein ACYTA3_10880 [Planctomycetota bacterium]|jgi:hypothetical protein